jgi:hypothetical protein
LTDTQKGSVKIFATGFTGHARLQEAMIIRSFVGSDLICLAEIFNMLFG